MTWGERRKAAEAAAKMFNGHSFNGGGPGHDIEHIDRIVREGAPAGAKSSDTFHMVVGHFVGCGLTVEHIYEHLQQFADGIGSRYLAEGRLSREISRSRTHQTQGRGADRADCMRLFKAAWERFAADEVNLTMFLAEKRGARRVRTRS